MLLELVSKPQSESSDAWTLAAFLKIADEVESLAVEHGLLKKSTTLETKELFRNLDLARQGQILTDLRKTLTLLKTLQLTTTTSGNALDRDIKHLTSFLQMSNMKLGDDRFFDYVDEGDMIEVYDSRAIQIYRNWAVFRYCPYSLIELLVNDWNTLFVRPSWVIERLIELTPALFAPGARTVKYDFPEYLISARLQRPAKGLLFKMKYASPVLDIESGMPTAFVTTGMMRPAPETETGRNIDFI